MEYPAVKSLKNRVLQLYSPEILSSLKEIHYAKGDYEVSGFISSLSTDQPAAQHKLACVCKCRHSEIRKHLMEPFLFFFCCANLFHCDIEAFFLSSQM